MTRQRAGAARGAAAAHSAEGRIAAVAGIDPGVVRQLVEELVLDVVDQGVEVLLRTEGVADAAGEQAVAGEQVRTVRSLVEQSDRSRRMADEMDHGQFAVT